MEDCVKIVDRISRACIPRKANQHIFVSECINKLYNIIQII